MVYVLERLSAYCLGIRALAERPFASHGQLHNKQAMGSRHSGRRPSHLLSCYLA